MPSIRNLLALIAIAAAGIAHAQASGEPAQVNINTADAATLARVLSGVGLKKAQAIVAYRDENGPFASIEDLVRVRGIGTATLDSNRERLSVNDPGEDPAASNPG